MYKQHRGNLLFGIHKFWPRYSNQSLIIFGDFNNQTAVDRAVAFCLCL